MTRREDTPGSWGRWLLVPVVGSILVAPAACGDDDKTSSGGGFKSFEPAAEDPMFSQPRDAVPLDNGGFAFIARANGMTSAPDDAAEEGTLAAVNDRYGVFVVDAPKGAPRLLYTELVAPFNIATDGHDKLWIADLGGGEVGQGAILELPIGGGSPVLLAEGFQPQGLATDKNDKVFFTGKDKTTGEPGVFALEGPTPVLVGQQFRTPSGIDVADDGTIYVADPTAAANVDDDNLVDGPGQGVIFKITGGALSVVTAGFEGGYPTGLVFANGRLVLSAYKDRGQQSAVLLIDPASPKNATVVTEKLEDTFSSAGLHKSRKTGAMAWSGGNTVYTIHP